MIRRCLSFMKNCKNFKQLEQIHGQFVTTGLGNDGFFMSRIMAVCSNPQIQNSNYAELIFQRMENPDLCLRNNMMKALLACEEYAKIMKVYCTISSDGFFPDNYTLPYILKACANLQELLFGAAIHGHILQLGFTYDEFVNNTLMLMYMDCGDVSDARRVFDEIPVRTVVSWNVMISGYAKLGKIEGARAIFDMAPLKDRGIWGSMISGYVQNNCFKECLLMFRSMQCIGVEPDEGVLISILTSCAQLGAMDLGKWAHCFLRKAEFPLTVQLNTALVDMYLKCGKSALAMKIFDQMTHRDVISWNVMIFGLAVNGHGVLAVNLYNRMQEEGFEPDDATFLAVLAACNHSGMVDKGLRIFHSMRHAYNIRPRGEHYCCVVDFLARAGRFSEAKEVIETMSKTSSSSDKAIAWRALLSACRYNRQTTLAKVAAENALQLEDHSGAYVLLSNVYENSGKYEDSRTLRKSMKDRGVSKVPGCSLIEITGRAYEFVAGEQINPEMEEIYSMLAKLNDHLDFAGCRSPSKLSDYAS